MNHADHGVGPDLGHGLEGKGDQTLAELDEDEAGSAGEARHRLEQLQPKWTVLRLGEVRPGVRGQQATPTQGDSYV